MGAVSCVVESWIKMNSCIQEKGYFIQRALESRDNETLRLLWQDDREAMTAAAVFAVLKNLPEELMKALEFFR